MKLNSIWLKSTEIWLRKKTLKASTEDLINQRQIRYGLSNQLIFLRLQVQKSEQRLSIGVKSAQMFRFINDIRNTNKTGSIRDRITKAPRTSGCDRGYYAWAIVRKRLGERWWNDRANNEYERPRETRKFHRE